MANGVSGSFELSGTQGMTLEVSYSETYDVSGNKSDVSITQLRLKSSDWLGITYYLDGTIAIAGSTAVSMDSGAGYHGVTLPGSTNVYATAWGTLGGVSGITHDNDGSKKITISVNVKGYIKGGGTSSGWSVSGSKEITLTTIPRASYVSLGAETVQMGKKVTIMISRASSSFTHTLRYGFGTETGTIATGVKESYEWTVPVSLVEQIPNAAIGRGLVFCDTYNGSAYIGTSHVDLTATAPDATMPSVSAESVNMGSSVTINMPRAVPQYKHTLNWVFADANSTIDFGLDTMKTWQVPLDLAKLIRAKTSDTMKIICITYNGTAEVGSKSVLLTLNVPDNEDTKPAAQMTVTAAGDLPAAFDGLFIRGKTGVKADYDASSEYSQISSYTTTVEGKKYTGDPAISGLLTGSGAVTVTGVVADARGYTRTVQKDITVIPYDKPRVVPYTGESKVVCARCRKDGTLNPKGEYLLIKAGRSYFPVTADGVQRNFCDLRYRHKAASADSYSEWSVLLEKADTESDTVIVVLEGIVPAVKTAYTIQIMAEDDIGGHQTVTIPIPAAILPIHGGEGGRNAAIGQYCDYSHTDAFDIAFTTYFNTGIHLRRIFESGTGWSAGQALEDTVPEADVAAVGLYSVFMAVVSGVPVLCLRNGGGIFGGWAADSLYAIRMTYTQSEEGGSSLVLDTAGGKTITALYALL